ncbi:hypothetical protein [Faecalimonas umbilicata]|uniref:hypothetical protein n=1 Tax=Faecalimonas umbilicata TaxID=1912855 RepID=UPI0022E41FF8|nr:hypothetical protein [Faecalimonas umbilicata]
MGRTGYLSLVVPDETKVIFDRFTEELGITKAEATRQMLEIYMLATDEERYLRLKKQFLHIEKAKPLILENRISKSNPYTFNALWARITDADALINGQILKLSPEKIIRTYQQTIHTLGATFFSCNGPARNTGITEKRQEYLRTLLDSGIHVPLYLSLDNETLFRADILEVLSSPEKFKVSNTYLVPSEFAFEKNRTWIKIKNLHPVQDISSRDLRFENGNTVRMVMKKGQLSFGYILE